MGVRHKQIECRVPYALGIILIVSRVFGVAPLRFRKQYDCWHVSVSRAVHVYSYLLFFFLNAGMLVGLIIDLGLPVERSVRVRTKSATVVYILEVGLLSLIATVGVCRGPGRMTSMINCLNQIDKIKAIYKNGSCKESHKMRRFSLMCVFAAFLWTICMYGLDLCTFIHEAIYHDRELKVVCIYITFYILSFIMIILELQFVAIAFIVNSAFKAVNEVLKDIIYVYDLKRIASKSSKIYLKTFRGLILSYGTVCDAVREVDRSHGMLVLLLLAAMLLQLVITPYYLFMNMKLSYDAESTEKGLVLQAFFIMFHTMRVVVLNEAGHVTQVEMDKTRMLVSHIAGRTRTSDPLAEEVNLFFKQIELNKVAYAPLGICTLTRPLISSIIGSVTTYLVIILQLQALDND